MGWVQMSKRDLQHIEVLAGRRTMELAAGDLGVSLRETQRLLAKYQDRGGAALIHRPRVRTATSRLNDSVRDHVLELVRQNYRNFVLTPITVSIGTVGLYQGCPGRSMCRY